MLKTKADRILIAAVSIFLALLMTLLLPVQRIAAAEEKQELYISEVRLGYGKNAEEAAKSLEGYTILKNGDKYADLNEGSGKKTVVLMGYKTTTKREEAITDIAAMNMKGGYSFAEYKKLMEQYRDSQIMPFINRFMATVNEYRSNYNGTDKNNRAKAEYVREMLNMYTDDDTGMGLGDVFLKTTAEELGLDKYEKLSDSEKKKYGCLSTILMQGKTSTIFFIEQILTLASDTSDTTWLQRFSRMSAESLLKEYTDKGMGETDAKNALAREYEEGARIIADKWEYFRNELIDYDSAIVNEDGGVIPDEDELNILDGSSSDDEETGDEEEMTDEEAEEILGDQNTDDLLAEMVVYSTYLEEIISDAAIDSSGDVRISFLYNYLRAMDCGDKTMYDFFTQPYNEIEKNNFFALYPLVASLTKGQLAGMEFLTLEQLVTVGSTDNTSYEKIVESEKEILKNAETVSVFEGVNRELYSDKVALTDKAMRDNASDVGDDYEKDLNAIQSRAFNIAMCSVLLIIPTVGSISSAIKAIRNTKPSVVMDLNLSEQAQASLNKIRYYAANNKKGLIFVDRIKNSQAMSEYVSEAKKFSSSSPEKLRALDSAKQLEKTKNQFNKLLISETKLEKTAEGTKVLIKTKSGEVTEAIFPPNVEVTGDNLDDIISNIEKKGVAKTLPAVGTKWGAVLKTGIAAVFSLALLGFTIYDIVVTAIDLYNYYHVDMTVVPKYIVDRKDLTMTDNNGNTFVEKNEQAYYQAIGSNRAKDHKFYETMQDYGDVNAAEGKQWLVLYTNNNTSVNTPILADSLKVVTGSNNMPYGYTTGIHMFGEAVPVNMTNKHYTYDDEKNGIYVYYAHASALSTSSGASGKVSSGEAPAMSSAFGTGNGITMAVCGFLVGIAVGVFIMAVIKRKNEAGTE